jgi:hypothetical protein
MSNKKVMQQALECIERLNMRGFILADFETEVYAAITTLREALAQEHALHELARLGQEIEQEPDLIPQDKLFVCGQMGANITRVTAQPEQEPVAYYHPHKGFYWAKPTHISAPTVVDVPPVPLYVRWKAAQRTWMGLTKVQRDDFADAYGSYQAVCDIEQALKERNT